MAERLCNIPISPLLKRERGKPMSERRLIDANELMKNVLQYMPRDQSDLADSAIPPIENLTVSLLMEIEEAQTIEERKTGKWIRCEKDDEFWYECSACKGFPLKNVWNGLDELSEYCPHCGARMEGVDNEQVN